MGVLFKILAVFFVFDLVTRECLFEFTLPHLKIIAANRQDVYTMIAAGVSEMSDKYAYIVLILCSYHVLDTSKAFVVSVTIYSALGVLSILKSFYHEPRPFFVTDLTPT